MKNEWKITNNMKEKKMEKCDEIFVQEKKKKTNETG